MWTSLQKAIVDSCDLVTARGKNKAIMTLSPGVDVIVVNILYLVERCTKISFNLTAFSFCMLIFFCRTFLYLTMRHVALRA